MQYGKAQTGGKKADDDGTKSIKPASSVCGSQAFLGSAEKIHWWALIFPVISLSILLNGSCWQGNLPPFSKAELRQRHPLFSCESHCIPWGRSQSLNCCKDGKAEKMRKLWVRWLWSKKLWLPQNTRLVAGYGGKQFSCTSAWYIRSFWRQLLVGTACV